MEQGSEEWFEKRGGRITASRFGDVLANPSTKRYRYYMEDIIELLHGLPRIEKTTPWFDHGKEMEPEAIGLYEWTRCVETQRVGFITHPKYNFIGCSPDGLVGEDGGMEAKSHVSAKQFLKSKKEGMPTNYKPQVQGSLWITGRKWWDFTSYYRNGEKRLIHIRTVYPDLEYHKMLEERCLDFWNKIQEKLK